MRDKIFIFWLLAAAITGCTRDVELSSGYVSSSDAIDFSATSEDSTTKGEVITTENISEIDVYAYYTAQNEWSAADVSPMLFMQNQSVSRTYYEGVDGADGSWGSWLYSPTKYWPSNEVDKISFFAFAPYDEIDVATDATTGKPIFTHTLSSYADENEDLLAGVEYDVTNDNGPISFELTHTLTKLLLYARTEGENLDDVDKNNVYTINGISIIGLYPTRTLEIDESGDCSWKELSDDDMASQEKISIVAAQGATLKSKDDYALLNYDSESDEANYTEVTATGQAIFVHPQELEGEGIQLQLRIRCSDPVDESTIDVIYQTEEVDLPTSIVKEWVMGEVIALYFTFDIGNLSEYETPLTVQSEVFDWTEVDVEVDVHRNIYIYSNLSDIIATTTTTDDVEYKYGEFMICTNYDYNLRVPHHREELDGKITSSRGFLFYSSFEDDGTYHVGTYEDDGDKYKIFVPTLLDKDGKEVVYVSKDNLSDYGYSDVDQNSDGSYTLKNNEIIYFGENDYAYHLNTKEEAEADADVIEGLYRLLYYNTDDNDNSLEIFDYINDPDTGYHEIDLSNFADDDDDEGTVYFKIKIMAGYEFNFSVSKSNRTDKGLFVSTAIDDSTDSYGVNKEGDDPVYTLRLSVNSDHLAAADGKFEDIIGVEMISNGGGMITQLFPVTLTDPTYTAK